MKDFTFGNAENGVAFNLLRIRFVFRIFAAVLTISTSVSWKASDKTRIGLNNSINKAR